MAASAAVSALAAPPLVLQAAAPVVPAVVAQVAVLPVVLPAEVPVADVVRAVERGKL